MYDFVTIDFETANKNLNSACSVGLAVVENLEIIQTEYFYVKPPTDHFSNDNVLIHGITYDDVKDCQQFPNVWYKIKDYFNEIIIAHNAQFDISILKNLSDTYNLNINNFTYIDSITISNAICDCGTSLKDRASFFGIEIGTHHNALDDAIACANIVISTIKEYGSSSFLHFAVKYDNIKAKDFHNIKANKTFGKSSGLPTYQNIRISDVVAATSEFNVRHPLYGKSIVLTGELKQFERKEAMQKIADVGGIKKALYLAKQTI